jgi:hypothetical protein
LIKLAENSNLVNLYSKPDFHEVSKAFSISKNTAAVDILLLKLRVTWFVSRRHCSVVLCCVRKPNWLVRVLSSPLSSICFWKIFKLLFRIVCQSWTGG